MKTAADVLARGAVLARERPDLVEKVNVEMREEQVRLDHARARGMPGLAAMSVIETFEVRLVRLADAETAGALEEAKRMRLKGPAAASKTRTDKSQAFANKVEKKYIDFVAANPAWLKHTAARTAARLVDEHLDLINGDIDKTIAKVRKIIGKVRSK